MIRSPRPLAALACLLTFATTILAPTPPARAQDVFSTGDFHTTKKSAENLGRILLVFAIHEDFPQCTTMQQSTFANPRVAAWLRENAVCFKFDALVERGEAQRFNTRKYPTTIILRDGQEIDRITQALSPNQFLNFVKQANNGRTRAQRYEAQYRAMLRQGHHQNIQTRYDWANRLLKEGAYAAATEEFLFLWNNAVEIAPHFADTRRSLMPTKIKTLCFRYTPAFEAFSAVRDEITPRIDPDLNPDIKPDDLQDWIVLSAALRQSDAIADWAQSIADHHDIAILNRGERHLFDVLIKPCFQWGLAGQVYRDPMEFINKRAERWGDRLYQDEVVDSYHLEDYTRMYAALLAAERIDEAIMIANGAIDFIDEAATKERLAEKAQLAGVDPSLYRAWESQDAPDD